MGSKIICWDTEADGLLEDATKIHCLVMQELGSDRFYEVSGNVEQIRKGTYKAIKEGYSYVAHNQFGYDLPLADRLLDIPFTVHPDTFAGKSVQLIDTLAWSRELNPDRIGGHSLDKWGERLGIKKPEVTDWENLTTEEYLHRGREDVRITGAVLEALFKEAEIKV